MKSIIALFAILFSSSVFACPALSGKYSCVFTSTTDASTWVVTQNNLAYDFDMGSDGGTLEVVADGQKHKAKNGDDMLASCQANVLNVADVTQTPNFIAEVTIDSAGKIMTLKYWQNVPNPEINGWTCTRQ